MTYTGYDILARVQRQFGDESGVQLIEDDVSRWIDDALREIATQNPDIYSREVVVSAVAGVRDYSTDSVLLMTSDVNMIKSIHFKESDSVPYYALKYVTPTELDDQFDGWSTQDHPITGTPICYTRGSGRRNSIAIIPVPADSLGTIKFTYYKTAWLSGGLSTDMYDVIHENYHNLILEYCLMKAYEMDEDWEAAERKAQYVQSTMDILAYRETDVAADKYPVISVYAGDL